MPCQCFLTLSVLEDVVVLLIDDHTLETAPEIDQIVSLISVISVINVINVINIFQDQFLVLGPCCRQIRNCLLLMRSARTTPTPAHSKHGIQ